jgi:hypothetical protein
MVRRRALRLAIASATLLAGAPARAEIRLGAAAAPAIATGDGDRTRFGAGAVIAADLRVSPRDRAGLSLRRFHLDGLSRALTTVTVSYRRLLADERGLAPFVGVDAGLGLYTGCIANGACDATGLALGAELGLRAPLSRTFALELAFAPVAQIPAPRGAGVIVAPTLTLSLAAF